MKRWSGNSWKKHFLSYTRNSLIKVAIRQFESNAVLTKSIIEREILGVQISSVLFP